MAASCTISGLLGQKCCDFDCFTFVSFLVFFPYPGNRGSLFVNYLCMNDFLCLAHYKKNEIEIKNHIITGWRIFKIKWQLWIGAIGYQALHFWVLITSFWMVKVSEWNTTLLNKKYLHVENWIHNYITELKKDMWEREKLNNFGNLPFTPNGFKSGQLHNYT